MMTYVRLSVTSKRLTMPVSSGVYTPVMTHTSSAMGCKNKGRMCESQKRRQAMTCCIRQVLHAQTWHVRIWQVILSNDMQYHQRPSLISHFMCTYVGWLQSYFECIIYEASALACIHQQCDIINATSSKWRGQQPRPAGISCGVCAST